MPPFTHGHMGQKQNPYSLGHGDGGAKCNVEIPGYPLRQAFPALGSGPGSVKEPGCQGSSSELCLLSLPTPLLPHA